MRFEGPIECCCTASACVTLSARAEHGERAYLTLAVAAPADLPPRLDVGTVEWLDGGSCRIVTPGREWRLESRRSFVHRDASAAFYAALPPRRVPLAKRMLFRLMLAAAGSRIGRRWLR
ncbi:MAG: hypothetical protein ACREUT_18405 [Steroidobacteraceae bacterium]